jgi:hypothetical protein
MPRTIEIVIKASIDDELNNEDIQQNVEALFSEYDADLLDATSNMIGHTDSVVVRDV